MYDSTNQLIYSESSAGHTTFMFDADGNQEVVLEPTGDRTTTTWDYENRSTLVVKPDDSRVTMTFDPDNLRTEKVTSTGTTKFVWDSTESADRSGRFKHEGESSSSLLMETDGTDTTGKFYTLEPAFYGNVISESSAGNSCYYHFDALGSTRNLTSSTGTVTDSWIYDAWGNIVSHTGTSDIVYLWIGKLQYYYDAKTGKFTVRVRDYNPTIARWESIDPSFSDGVDWYLYVLNNAVNAVDPSGLKNVLGTFSLLLTQCTGETATRYLGGCCLDVYLAYHPTLAEINTKQFILKFGFESVSRNLGGAQILIQVGREMTLPILKKVTILPKIN